MSRRTCENGYCTNVDTKEVEATIRYNSDGTKLTVPIKLRVHICSECLGSRGTFRDG